MNPILLGRTTRNGTVHSKGPKETLAVVLVELLSLPQGECLTVGTYRWASPTSIGPILVLRWPPRKDTGSLENALPDVLALLVM